MATLVPLVLLFATVRVRGVGGKLCSSAIVSSLTHGSIPSQGNAISLISLARRGNFNHGLPLSSGFFFF